MSSSSGMITEHCQPLSEVLAKFGTHPERGLSGSGVAKQRIVHGWNELSPPHKTPGWIKFLAIAFHGVSLLLWVGAVLCFIAFGIQVSPVSKIGQDLFKDAKDLRRFRRRFMFSM